MGAIKVVIDTNVLVSALLFGGPPGQLIQLSKTGRIKPLASKEIINEYLRVLTYPKFKLSEEEIKYLLYEEILTQFDVVDVQPGATIIHEDPDDDKFIRCALTGHAGFIITGDQHLSAINSYHSLKILTAVQFLTKYKIDS